MEINCTVNLIVKTNFGREDYHPDCKLSEMICKIAKKKSMNEEMVLQLKKYGFKIQYIGIRSVFLESIGAERK